MVHFDIESHQFQVILNQSSGVQHFNFIPLGVKIIIDSFGFEDVFIPFWEWYLRKGVANTENVDILQLMRADYFNHKVATYCRRSYSSHETSEIQRLELSFVFGGAFGNENTLQSKIGWNFVAIWIENLIELAVVGGSGD